MDICQIHLGPRGPEATHKSELIARFRDEQSRSLVSTAGLVLDADALDKHGARIKELRGARFFSFRDGSASSKDIRGDGDKKRSRRWLSVTRDIMSAQVWDSKISQELYTMPPNYPGRDSMPGFGRYSDNAGVDHDRFINEAAALKMRGLIEELPDFDCDESMVEFLGKVHDLALEDAPKRNIDNKKYNRIIDAAPGLYLFSELLKRTERLIEEDFTELWARRIFPILNLNTWLPQWSFERIDDRTTLPKYVDLERQPSNAPRGRENRAAELRNLAFYHHGASWSKLELMRYAEAMANGAPNIAIDRRRINNAVRMMNFKEDLITFFGDTDVDILGLFSDFADTGIERISSALSGGPFGTGPVSDRDLLIDTVEKIGKDTEQALLPDTIMLSTESWYHVNKTLYGSVDSDAGNNRTVLDMSMQSLEKFGIKDILWVPEVGYSAQQEKRLKAHSLNNTEAQKYAGGIGDGLQSMVVCKRDSDVMEMVVAKDRTMFPTETHNDRVETRMMQGSGGFAAYKPAGIKIVTNVGPLPPP